MSYLYNWLIGQKPPINIITNNNATTTSDEILDKYDHIDGSTTDNKIFITQILSEDPDLELNEPVSEVINNYELKESIPKIITHKLVQTDTIISNKSSKKIQVNINPDDNINNKIIIYIFIIATSISIISGALKKN